MIVIPLDAMGMGIQVYRICMNCYNVFSLCCAAFDKGPAALNLRLNASQKNQTQLEF